MFQLTINFATVEGLQDAVLKLSGDAGQPQLPLTAPAKTTKAAEKKAAQTAATAEGVAAPAAPAAVKGKAKAKKVTLDELKAKVAEYVDPAKDGDKIKAFARSRGVAKYGDLSEDAIQEAYAAVDEYFTSGEGAEGEAEEDPMS